MIDEKRAYTDLRGMHEKTEEEEGTVRHFGAVLQTGAECRTYLYTQNVCFFGWQLGVLQTRITSDDQFILAYRSQICRYRLFLARLLVLVAARICGRWISGRKSKRRRWSPLAGRCSRGRGRMASFGHACPSVRCPVFMSRYSCIYILVSILV